MPGKYPASASPSAKRRLSGRGPSPVPDFGLVDAFGVGVVNAFDDLSLEPFFKVGAGTLQPGNAIDDVDGKVEAIDLIYDREFQRRIDVALLFVPAHVNVVVIRPPIGELVDEPRVSVEIENDGLVFGKQRVKVRIRETVRMLRIGLKPVQVNHVDEPNLKIRKVLAKNGHCG